VEIPGNQTSKENVMRKSVSAEEKVIEALRSMSPEQREVVLNMARCMFAPAGPKPVAKVKKLKPGQMLTGIAAAKE
jgi:hypothetical protein